MIGNGYLHAQDGLEGTKVIALQRKR
jgi:hypothetical protein